MTVVASLLLVAAWLLAIPLSVTVGVLALQVVAAATAGRRRIADARGGASARASLAVLVPAHNEEGGIAATLAAILPQLRACDRLLVVADNCSDGTAEQARAAGAEVLVRTDDTLRGKGYALAHGVDHLRARPPAAVVLVDADCELGPGALDALMHSLAVTGRPVQALYLMLAPPDAGLGRRLAEFAWRVRNWVRPAGWHRLGLPCQLMGTGMAFSWAMLAQARLANASIVEDMKLGADLALDGVAPVFCDRALVTSRFPDSVAASGTQRTRWEHGHIEMILRELPRLLRAALARRDARILGLALDLAVPPLALLAGLLALDGMLAVVGWLLGGGVAAWAWALLLLGGFGCTILLAWAFRARDLVRLAELLMVPWYIVSKLPIYLRFIVRRQKAWVRTDRK
jgi:cellulose synthase/poly-beta-1,6-N-acetylglucosamine synthase-like glycosyltransferase